MDYNKTYLDIKNILINFFLKKHNENILDISYLVNDNIINIQIILLENSDFELVNLNKMKQELIDYKLIINKVFMSKEKYNLNSKNWTPINYKWLDNVLLSKLEI